MELLVGASGLSRKELLLEQLSAGEVSDDDDPAKQADLLRELFFNDSVGGGLGRKVEDIEKRGSH